MAKGLILYFDIDTGFYPGLHHGLAYLLGAVKQENDIDFMHIFKEEHITFAKNEIEGKQWDFVGVSFTTNQKKFLRELLRITDVSKQFFIAGGVHPTLDKENIFKDFPQIDGICIGEGEKPLLELCRRLDKGKDIYTTPSFWFKVSVQDIKEGKKRHRKKVVSNIVQNMVAPLVHIDKLPEPDYTIFDYKRIISDNADKFPMMLGRGCPYQCAYCCNVAISNNYSNKGEYTRFPSIRRSIEKIKNNLALYPRTQSIIFADDTFTVKKLWLHEFCKVYKYEIDLPFECNARVETISDSVCEDLKLAGCKSIDFGVESGNEWLRRNILNRKHNNEIIVKAFETVHKHGIKAFAFNIIGMPFETREMMKDTFKLNKRLNAEYGRAFYYYPYPGTAMHEISLKLKIMQDNIENLTGYLEAPSVKEYFATHKDIRKYYNKLNLFFTVRIILSKLKLPKIIQTAILFFSQVLWQPLASFHSQQSNRIIIAVRAKLKIFAIRYLR